MQELVSPAQSELIVIALALALSLIGGAVAWRLYNARAAGLVVLSGVLMFATWQVHKWLTRFDPQTGYFGLQSVPVLLIEALAFIAVGTFLGWLWSRIAVKDEYKGE